MPNAKSFPIIKIAVALTIIIFGLAYAYRIIKPPSPEHSRWTIQAFGIEMTILSTPVSIPVNLRELERKKNEIKEVAIFPLSFQFHRPDPLDKGRLSGIVGALIYNGSGSIITNVKVRWCYHDGIDKITPLQDLFKKEGQPEPIYILKPKDSRTIAYGPDITPQALTAYPTGKLRLYLKLQAIYRILDLEKGEGEKLFISSYEGYLTKEFKFKKIIENWGNIAESDVIELKCPSNIEDVESRIRRNSL